jgi:hypothetical protein
MEEEDGNKLLGGDHTTIDRWWKSKREILSGEIGLSNNLMNQKRKVLFAFLR